MVYHGRVLPRGHVLRHGLLCVSHVGDGGGAGCAAIPLTWGVGRHLLAMLIRAGGGQTEKFLQTCRKAEDRLAVILMLLWGGGKDRLVVYLQTCMGAEDRPAVILLFLWGGGRDRLAVYLMAWRRGRGGMLRRVMASQSLFSLTWFELLSHKITQLAEERYFGGLLLLLLSQVGGYDGD